MKKLNKLAENAIRKHVRTILKEMGADHSSLLKENGPSYTQMFHEECRLNEFHGIFEHICQYAQTYGKKPFEVLDEMMVMAESEERSGPNLNECDCGCGEEESVDHIEPVTGELPQQNPPEFSAPGEWGFKHGDTVIKNPLLGPQGEDVDPVEFYGAAFMGSNFPFVHGEFVITDPRYDETGTVKVEPELHYGDAYRQSDYYRLNQGNYK